MAKGIRSKKLPETVAEKTTVPGGKEAGETGRAELAAYLLKELPYSQRAKIVAECAKAKSGDDASYASFAASRLAAVRYANEVNGIVTMVQEKGQDSSVELPQIIVHGEPPPRPGSREALELLQQAKGSQYDEKFPLSPPAPREPPKPFKSAVSVQERSGA